MNALSLSDIIEEKAGSPVSSLTPLRGGSISSAYKAALQNGKSLFIKTSPQYPDMFEKELHGLAELRTTNTIKVPETVFCSRDVLILEFLPVSMITNRKKFFENFGIHFARMHRYTDSSFGFYEDNYIGSTIQPNTVRALSWREFYLEHRLKFQFRLAEVNNHADSALTSAFIRLEKIIDVVLPNDNEPPALLHGDLWNGNYLSLENDIPAIIDPAVYYGHREADLGMTLLFGGFDDSFYDAYNSEYPLNGGWKQRVELYKLYHLLNHLNLFGGGYYGQVMEAIRNLVR